MSLLLIGSEVLFGNWKPVALISWPSLVPGLGQANGLFIWLHTYTDAVFGLGDGNFYSVE
jgi:hypothetical protein